MKNEYCSNMSGLILFWRSYANFKFLSSGPLFGSVNILILTRLAASVAQWQSIGVRNGRLWIRVPWQARRHLLFVHSKEDERHFALPSICVAETSGFLWILADVQWFLAKNLQFLNCLTRKKGPIFSGFFSGTSLACGASPEKGSEWCKQIGGTNRFP